MQHTNFVLVNSSGWFLGSSGWFCGSSVWFRGSSRWFRSSFGWFRGSSGWSCGSFGWSCGFSGWYRDSSGWSRGSSGWFRSRALARNEEFSKIAVINFFTVLKNKTVICGGILRGKFRDKSTVYHMFIDMYTNEKYIHEHSHRFAILPADNYDAEAATIDENDAEAATILRKMHESHLQWINDRESAAKADTYRHHKQSAQGRLRAMKEQWWSDRATELQEAGDRKNAKLFYDGLKAIYGPQANGSSSILSAGADTRLTEPSRILERWAEHFIQRCAKPVIHNFTGRDRQHSTATADGRTSAAPHT